MTVMRVFIGHAEPDREWVVELADSLRAEGLDVWLDASEVEPGENWLRAAAQALDRADAMVLVFSEDGSDSPELQKAFEFALTSPRFKDHLVTVERKKRGQRTPEIPLILKKLAFVPDAANPRVAARRVLRLLRRAA